MGDDVTEQTNEFCMLLEQMSTIDKLDLAWYEALMMIPRRFATVIVLAVIVVLLAVGVLYDIPYSWTLLAILGGMIAMGLILLRGPRR